MKDNCDSFHNYYKYYICVELLSLKMCSFIRKTKAKIKTFLIKVQ